MLLKIEYAKYVYTPVEDPLETEGTRTSMGSNN